MISLEKLKLFFILLELVPAILSFLPPFFLPMSSATTLAWAKALPGNTGFSRYFVGVDGVKWALLTEVEEDLIKFDLLCVSTAGNQLYTFSADDRIWQPIQEETRSAAPLEEFLADVLEALKTRKPTFKTNADGSVSLEILYKEMRWYRFEASLPFTLKDAAVSSSLADLLLRQARIHDYAKMHPVVAPEVAPIAAVAATVAPTVVETAPAETRTSNDALKAAVAEERRSRVEVPRGKNPKGISFGSKR